MKLTKKPFIFLRHGETPMNQLRLIAGSTDTPLSDTGREEARRAAELLADIHWSVIGVSPLQRAHETAQLATSGQQLTLLEGLRERDWGDLEGAPWETLIPYTETPAGGENWDHFTQRVLLALNQLLEHEMPLVVAHSGIFRVIRALATGTPEGDRVGNAQPVLVLPPDGNQSTWTFINLTSDNMTPSFKEQYFG
ncbi:histidine phosphatase family protein [Nitrincola sp. MINF-07-Sa-05]|uniref:histidine phosphatase family protein n=1 Tax=Nitrincola salilacus TaxID=3400273 RepID=UPI00391819F3